MAVNPSQLKGWSYQLADEANIQNKRVSRRTREAASANPDADLITLKRDSDKFTIKPGDCLLYNDKSDKDSDLPNVAVVRDITFGTEVFLELKVFVFYRLSEVELENLPENVKNKSDTLPESYSPQDVFMTPILNKIFLKDVVGSCQVLSKESFEKMVIDDSNSNTCFRCRRFCDEDADYITDEIDWDQAHKEMLANPPKFTASTRLFTVRPTDNTKPRKFKKSTKSTKSSKKRPHDQLKEYFSKKIKGPSKKQEEAKSYAEDSDSVLGSESDYSSEESSDDEEVDFFASKNVSRRSSPKKAITPKGTPRGRKKASLNFKKQLFSNNRTPRTSRRLMFDEDEKELDIDKLSPRKKLNFSNLPDDTSNGKTTTMLRKAKHRLHTSAKLNSLPCRDDEFNQIYYTLANAIENETGCCIYVSGTPGVGKTATIREVVKQLSFEINEDSGDKKFEYLEINGLKLVVPQAAYSNLWNKINPNSRTKTGALRHLEEYFESGNRNKRPLVILLDELDQIVTRNQSVMYNFFNWPSYENSKLIVIAVANTMDLPERMLTNKISSRLGLTRIQFPGYTYNQLCEIIKHRLDHLSKQNEGKLIISNDAVEFASRKVASVSGDARRSLIICVRAIEIAEEEFESLSQEQKDNIDGKYTVKINHIMKAITENTGTPVIKYLNTLTFQAKVLLAAILLRQRRTGLGEVVLGDVIDELNNQFAISQFKDLRTALKKEKMDIMDVVYHEDDSDARLRINGLTYILKDLEENGIVIQQKIRSERSRLIRLNVSEAEILSCFKKDDLLRDIVIET